MKLIKVTKQDIKTGVSGCPYSCPIANALNKQLNLPEDTYVAVRPTDVGFSYSVIPDIPLSRSAKRFISRFDNNKPVKPFKFKFDFIGSESKFCI